MKLFALASHSITLNFVSATITLVAFGDSYTDQSRLTYWNTVGSAPPPHYQSNYSVASANGGVSWVRYAEIYGGIRSYNYAVAGASCSNNITGRTGRGPVSLPNRIFPSVDDYQISAFLEDHWNGKQLDLPADQTVYSLWIGTNDVGWGALLTGNQTANGGTIVNVTQCAIKWAETLYHYGARNFIFQNMVPLELTPLYGKLDQPLDRYWPYERNRTEWAVNMRELVNSGNALWDLQVPAFAAKYSEASAAVFDSNQLFRDMYYNPSKYLNGSAPLNVTGYDAHSNITGGDTVVSPDPDSFLWFDSLHPSQQSSRQVAREIVKTLKEDSDYAVFLGKGSWVKL